MSYPPSNQPDTGPSDPHEASFAPTVAQEPEEFEVDLRSVGITDQQLTPQAI